MSVLLFQVSYCSVIGSQNLKDWWNELQTISNTRRQKSIKKMAVFAFHDFPYYHHLQGRIGFNTANPSLSTGQDYSVHSLMMNRMDVLHHTSDGARIQCPFFIRPIAWSLIVLNNYQSNDKYTNAQIQLFCCIGLAPNWPGAACVVQESASPCGDCSTLLLFILTKSESFPKWYLIHHLCIIKDQEERRGSCW